MQLFKIIFSLSFASYAVAQGKIKISQSKPRPKIYHVKLIVLHVVLLGDSITELTCWRAMVWDMLVKEDLLYKVLFVGSKTNNVHNCRAQSGTFDLHHEGHDGIQSIDVADHYVEGWLASSKPDIVQIMLGTNDVSQGRATSDIINSYTRMTDLIRESNPRAKIIVCHRSRSSSCIQAQR